MCENALRQAIAAMQQMIAPPPVDVPSRRRVVVDAIWAAKRALAAEAQAASKAKP